MKNRQNLRDYGIALIFIGILNLFNFATIIIDSFIDGTITNAFASIESDIIVAVRVVLTVIGLIMALISFADAFVGIKGIKVSAKPTMEKGYIIAATVFFCMSILSIIGGVIVMTDGNGQMLGKGLNIANSVLSACIYLLFIKAAKAVREDVIKGSIE